MTKSLKWRAALICAVIAIALLYLFPTFVTAPSWWEDNLPSEKISLGLDLQGGMHLLMEVEGRLPGAKQRLLGLLDRFLELPEEERTHFKLGRRMGFYQTLDDLQLGDRHAEVAHRVAELQQQYPGREDEICHYLRERVV